MAKRYTHGFYAPDIFCALIVRASHIPMDDHDRKIVYRDMLDSLTKFLTRLKIGEAYSLGVQFRTELSNLHVLCEQNPDLSKNKNVMVVTGRLDGVVQRLNEELFIYNQHVEDSEKSDTIR